LAQSDERSSAPIKRMSSVPGYLDRVGAVGDNRNCLITSTSVSSAYRLL